MSMPQRQLFEIQRMLAYFIAGCLFFLYNDKIPFTTFTFIAAFIALILCIYFKIYNFLGPCVYTYVIIGLAIKLPFHFVDKIGDYSYGIYIYSFPVEQMVYFINNNIKSPIYFFTISLLTVFPLAYLSWHIIEKPCLNLKKYKLNFRWNRNN